MSVTLYTPDGIHRGHMRETTDSEHAFVELRDYQLLLKAREEESDSWATLVAYAQEHWPMETGRNVADVFIEKMDEALSDIRAMEIDHQEADEYK